MAPPLIAPTAQPADPLAVEVLADNLSSFVRAFGLHRPSMTPCGSPLPVSEAHALMELHRSGALSQSDLTRRLELTKGTVSRIVGLLAARGWVKRAPSPSDRRVAIVELTPIGGTAAARLAQCRTERLGRLLDALPPHEREGVAHALAVLGEAARATS
jgi:DNA-binding MarR family transcriptional regulator